jgi:hypothetical protein
MIFALLIVLLATGRANACPMTGSAKHPSRRVKEEWIASSLPPSLSSYGGQVG